MWQAALAFLGFAVAALIGAVGYNGAAAALIFVAALFVISSVICAVLAVRNHYKQVRLRRDVIRFPDGWLLQRNPAQNRLEGLAIVEVYAVSPAADFDEVRLRIDGADVPIEVTARNPGVPRRTHLLLSAALDTIPATAQYGQVIVKVSLVGEDTKNQAERFLEIGLVG